VANANVAKAHKAIRFRGRSFIAFVLTAEAPLPGWLAELDKWTRNSPGFFVGRPVVLDLSGLRLNTAEITSLLAALAEREIRILGIEGVDEAQLGPSLPPLLKGGRPTESPEAPGENRSASATPEPADAGRTQPQSLLLDSPIRSGQSIIFPYGDVTVIGSVASGAEVAAGGSIHVYGALRGRALAGSMGNGRARIFCRKNEAELLAIDGYYLTAEAMDANLRSRAVQVSLREGVLELTPLD
jgi:septum site-determining protein MinC